MTMHLKLSGDEGFTPPGVKDFDLPPIFSNIEWLTKPVVLVAL
jgi:F-type H+-transporting ATPase subunit a